MRIVRGRLRGRDLLSPGGRIRPTAEQVRDRWLTELESELKGARVLDLFAGTGALGLEALSRGAARVDFVEWSAAALHALKGNVTALGARKRSRIFTRDAMVFIAALDEGAYDLALADPPYSSSLAGRVVELWQERPFARILSVEHPADAVLPPGGGGWTADGSGVTTYRARPAHETEFPWPSRPDAGAGAGAGADGPGSDSPAQPPDPTGPGNHRH